MTKISRRHFLKTCSMVTVGFMGLYQSGCAPLLRRPSPGRSDLIDAGYGPLVKDPQGILDLPKEFKYQIISRAGNKMNDGFFVPGLPDGMATFPAENGLTILIRNHELMPKTHGPYGKQNELLGDIPRDKIYDYGQGKTPSTGGTTTLIYDTKNQEVVSEYLSLTGTVRNCAGGATPWNSWITCEETVYRAGDFAERSYFDKDHGYNFEVPASLTPTLYDPVPLIDMGRFNHEAVAVDPDSGIVYQTEDRSDGLIYRFIPNVPGQLAKGGKLQALVISGEGIKDTRNWHGEVVPVGEKFSVEWIDMNNVESPDDDLRDRGYEAGAAKFARGEGMWRGEDGIYFACTNGGQTKDGQIFRYVPSPYEGTPEEKQQPGTVELFVEPNDSDLVKNADNLTIAPWGDLVVCEDRSGKVVRLVGVTPEGKLYTLAHHHKETEFAGATFSPDGSTLFVNMQGRGWTVAITGPWREPVA